MKKIREFRYKQLDNKMKLAHKDKFIIYKNVFIGFIKLPNIKF